MTDTKEDYKHLRSIADDPPRGKFVALFDDGSGASLFRFSGDTLYTEEGGIYAPEDGETHADVLIDFGYSHWLPLPDDYKVWGKHDPTIRQTVRTNPCAPGIRKGHLAARGD